MVVPNTLGVAYIMFMLEPAPTTVLIPVLRPAPHTSSHAVGILSSIADIPFELSPWLIFNVPRPPIVMLTYAAENAFAFACATPKSNVQPLSSSPEPLKVKFEPIPIGLPVA